jgi:hypothetical protein
VGTASPSSTKPLADEHDASTVATIAARDACTTCRFGGECSLLLSTGDRSKGAVVRITFADARRARASST